MRQWACACTLFVLAACEPRDAPNAPKVWSLPALEQAFMSGLSVLQGKTFPGGIRAATFFEPNADGTSRLRVLPAFSEGMPAAYVAAEMWTGYDEIWLQPWYSLVTAWDEKAPSTYRLKDADGKVAPAIYDVDVESTFYSPFWRVFWVVVPPETTPSTYTDSRALLAAGLPMYPGPAWIYSMRTASLNLGEGKPKHPLLGSEVGAVALGPDAWVEGDLKPSMNLGGNNFTYDKTDVVHEVALFWMHPRGTLPESAAAWPGVVGTGPFGARAPAQVVGNRPRFGGLCRLYLAAVPVTAAPFEPDASPAASALLTAANLDPAAYRGRVALNAKKVAMNDKTCFDDPGFPGSCTWLDSQAAVEDRLGDAAITRTEILMTCPFVTYAAKAVK